MIGSKYQDKLLITVDLHCNYSGGILSHTVITIVTYCTKVLHRNYIGNTL